MHDRVWKTNRYVYPVVSRRSKGISIGINLNPDKVCNFDCIYCSVDRKDALPATAVPPVDLALLRTELSQMIDIARTGTIYNFDPFDRVPLALRRINDIAFSGDGEPTSFPQFPQACELAVELATAAGLLPAAPSPSTAGALKIVVITNATMFHRPAVASALGFLDAHNGEIWAKLDAGTENYYHLIERTTVPYQRILDNLLTCARARPTVIQTLFMRVHNVPPSPEEIAAYAARLHHILQNGGQLKLIQLYTVARATTESYATPLTLEELTIIAAQIRTTLPTAVEVYP